MEDGFGSECGRMNADVSAPPCPFGQKRATHNSSEVPCTHEQEQKTQKQIIRAHRYGKSGGLAADPEANSTSDNKKNFKPKQNTVIPLQFT